MAFLPVHLPQGPAVGQRHLPEGSQRHQCWTQEKGAWKRFILSVKCSEPWWFESKKHLETSHNELLPCVEWRLAAAKAHFAPLASAWSYQITIDCLLWSDQYATEQDWNTKTSFVVKKKNITSFCGFFATDVMIAQRTHLLKIFIAYPSYRCSFSLCCWQTPSTPHCHLTCCLPARPKRGRDDLSLEPSWRSRCKTRRTELHTTGL